MNRWVMTLCHMLMSGTNYRYDEPKYKALKENQRFRRNGREVSITLIKEP